MASFLPEELNTGDILLVCNNSKNWFLWCYDKLIQFFTKSKYTHTVMVLKNPTFINKNLLGTYVYESGTEICFDAEDEEKKTGVQLTTLKVFLNDDSQSIYVRKLLRGRELITIKNLIRLHDSTHNKLYDFFPQDLLDAALKGDRNYQNKNRFFCSALVCYCLVVLGFLPAHTNWSNCTPADLSSDSMDGFLKFENSCIYGDDTLLKF